MSLLPTERSLKYLDRYAMAAMLFVSVSLNVMQYMDNKELHKIGRDDKDRIIKVTEDGYQKSNEFLSNLSKLLNNGRPKVVDTVYSDDAMQRLHEKQQ
jgi:hypothetical protein